MHSALDDPLGIKQEKANALQLNLLREEWNPVGQTESLLLGQVHFHALCNDPAKTRIALSSLLKMQLIRQCANDAHKAQIIEGFTKC